MAQIYSNDIPTVYRLETGDTAYINYERDDVMVRMFNGPEFEEDGKLCPDTKTFGIADGLRKLLKKEEDVKHAVTVSVVAPEERDWILKYDKEAVVIDMAPAENCMVGFLGEDGEDLFGGRLFSTFETPVKGDEPSIWAVDMTATKTAALGKKFGYTDIGALRDSEYSYDTSVPTTNGTLEQ